MSIYQDLAVFADIYAVINLEFSCGSVDFENTGVCAECFAAGSDIECTFKVNSSAIRNFQRSSRGAVIEIADVHNTVTGDGTTCERHISVDHVDTSGIRIHNDISVIINVTAEGNFSGQIEVGVQGGTADHHF